MFDISAVLASRADLICALFVSNFEISPFSVSSLCASVSRSTRHTVDGVPSELSLSTLVWAFVNAVRATVASIWLFALRAIVELLVPDPVVVPLVLAVVSVLVPEPVVVPLVLAVVSVLVPEPVVPLVLAVVSVLVPEPVVPLVLAVVAVLVPEPVVVPLVLAVVSVLVPVVDAAVLGVHVTPVPLSIVPVVDCAYAGTIASAAKATVERRSFLMFRSSGCEFFKGRIGRKARYSATVGATSLTRRCS